MCENKRIIDMVEVAEKFFRGISYQSGVDEKQMSDFDSKLRKLHDKVEELREQIAEEEKIMISVRYRAYCDGYHDALKDVIDNIVGSENDEIKNQHEIINLLDRMLEASGEYDWVRSER